MSLTKHAVTIQHPPGMAYAALDNHEQEIKDYDKATGLEVKSRENAQELQEPKAVGGWQLGRELQKKGGPSGPP